MNTLESSSRPSLKLILLITAVSLVLLLGVPARGNSGQDLEITSSNELTIIPSEKLSAPLFDSTLSVSYERGIFQFESETDFNLEGYNEQDLEFDLKFEALEGEIDLEFEDEKLLDTWESSIDLDLNPQVEAEVVYETDCVSGEGDEKPDRELEITIDQQYGEDVSVELSSEFTNEGGSFSFPPDITEIEFDDIGTGEFVLDSSLELIELKPMEIEFDLEREEPIPGDPDLEFQVDLTWGISEDFLQVEPEFETEFATLSFESEVDLTSAGFIGGLKVREVNLSDLVLGFLEIDITNDLETGETEVDFQTSQGPTEFDLGWDYNPTKTGSLTGFECWTGEFTWEPLDSTEIVVEMESDSETFPSEITFSSEYSF